MELEQSSDLYKPSLQEGDQQQPPQNFDQNLCEIQLMSVDQCDNVQEMEDSQLVGAPGNAVDNGADVAVRDESGMVDVEVQFVETAMGRRKRMPGRPPGGGRVKRKRREPPPPRRKKEEEDVCFICFDGGNLVLCDRKGCPKAYHPACIKRDDDFFKSKAKWNCGWHICSTCERASYYMCYTCTYSLCKGCIKGADYYCVRGNKGFCGVCLRTILLIEDYPKGIQEKLEVDFDDNTSWEYLFKVYWVCLKENLGLTLNELTQANNPLKEPFVTAFKGKSSGEVYGSNCSKGPSSENFCGDLEANHAKRKKNKKQPEPPNQPHSLNMEKSGGNKGMPLPEGAKWATNELLELVAHMRNGDATMMSQFDVQCLLLEYVKKYGLRDPRQKSQIVCDPRLLNLFGKARVGHFEMLKLLESHFLIQEHSPLVHAVKGVVASEVEAYENHDNQLIMENDKSTKTIKKADKRDAQANPNEYAAIDLHNIKLIYLKRSLMENLIVEADKFHDKVVGSIVRIKIPGSDQKPDMYRLVQVIGTSKAAEPYKIGERTTDVILEICNLQKREVVSIDTISNQEFSEDECRRLRQSIKCGFIKRMTVGKIQEKAMSLQALKVNDLLESEILRLTNLRDRASEKGHEKDLRECVVKLQILNSPEEHKRRLLEIPEVHADPYMDPRYESEEDSKEFDEKKQDNCLKPRNPSFGWKEKEPILGSKAQKGLATSLEQNMKVTMTDNVDRDGITQLHPSMNGSPWNQGKEFNGSAIDEVGSIIQVTACQDSNAALTSESSGISSGKLPMSNSAGMAKPIIDFETEKLWHYQDPAGRIQGPFSLVQLRKWSTSGHFPPGFLVWKINQKQDDSILLTDVLDGRYDKEPLLLYNSCLVPQQVRATLDDRGKTLDDEQSGSMDTTEKDLDYMQNDGRAHSKCVDEVVQNDGSAHSKSMDEVVQNDGSAHSKSMNEVGQNDGHAHSESMNEVGQNDGRAHSESMNEVVKSNSGGCESSSLPTLADVNSNEGRNGSHLQGADTVKENQSYSHHSPVCNSLPLPVLAEKPCEIMLHQVKVKKEGELWKSDQNSVNEGFCNTTEGQINFGNSNDKQVDRKEKPDQSSDQKCTPPTLDKSSNGWDAVSTFASFAKALEMSDQNQEINFSDLPSRTPRPSHGDLKAEDAQFKHSVPSEAQVQDSGPSWSTASSPVGCGPHLTDVAGEWVGYTPTPAKPSMEEWDPALMPASSLKPTEVASDHAATPTSGSCHLAHSSPSHPASNAGSWQAIEEFTSLADESVSDLLAEVEAMESLNRLASPTSTMRCGLELAQGSENDCFSPMSGLSPTPDPGKSDALSSSSDLQMHSHSTVTDEPLGVCQAEVHPHKSSGGRSSSSAEVEEDRKHSDDSVNQCEVGSDIQPTLPPVTSWNIAATDVSWRLGSETANISQGANSVFGGLAQRIRDVGLVTNRWTAQQHVNMNMGTSVGNPGIWQSQPMHAGDGLSAPRHNDFHAGNSSFERGRSLWNGQPIYDVGNGGYSFRLPPKGRQVCKFHESGFCRKGASCSYWHR